MTTYHFTIETTDYLNYGSDSVAVFYDEQSNNFIIKNNNKNININHDNPGNCRLHFSCESNPKLEPAVLKNALQVLHRNCNKLKTIDKFVNSRQDGVPLFIYPYSIDDSNDLDITKKILSVSVDSDNYYIKTDGLMGYISATFKNNESDPDDYHFNIYIHSRFDYHFPNFTDSEDSSKPDFNRDFFLHYMLQRIMNINLFDSDPDTQRDQNELGLLLYFFPGLLRLAMNQGLFKQYVHREYNDSRVRGPIDVSRHISCNIPFKGNVSYSTTEYDYDNPVTQLVRHTIEVIRHHEWAVELLKQTDKTRQDVQIIVANTERYHANERRRIIEQNCRLINHPFYTEWRPLQHLCLSILKHDDMRYVSEKDNDRIHGLLFDGPWLWESYLWWLFKNWTETQDFIHPNNKTRENAIRLFQNSSDIDVEAQLGKQSRTKKYPDFYKPFKNPEVLKTNSQAALEIWDAKFKQYDNNPINRDDVHQLITYLYIQSTPAHLCPAAGVIYPSKSQSDCIKFGNKLMGLGGQLYQWGLQIPSGKSSYSEFKEGMTASENTFKNKYISLLK